MGAQALGGLYQQNAMEQEAKAKQNYYNYLASQNEAQATRTIKAGEDQVSAIQTGSLQSQIELDRQSKQLEGRQKAVLARNGVWGNSRTAGDILDDTLTQEERDATALRYNAEVKSWESRTNAKETARALREQASGYRMGGDNARMSGEINRTTSLLSTVTNVADTWLRWKKA